MRMGNMHVKSCDKLVLNVGQPRTNGWNSIADRPALLLSTSELLLSTEGTAARGAAVGMIELTRPRGNARLILHGAKIIKAHVVSLNCPRPTIRKKR
jgi:hypothetical protein